MCGIFGIIFHSNPLETPERVNKAQDLFMYLSISASERGTDATGVARVDTDGYVGIYKNPKPSWEVVGYRRWWRIVQNMSPCTLALLGHTRWGTHGANTAENAHPFLFKGKHKLVGTHNGVIRNHETFGPQPKPFENDSANLLYGLSQMPREEWGDALLQVQGSMALAFSTEGMVHLTRNLGSPCELGYCPELDATVYCSTREIARWALEKADVRLDGMRYLPSGELWTFTPGARAPVVQVYDDWGYSTASSTPRLLPSSTGAHTAEASACRKAWQRPERDFKQDVEDELRLTPDTECRCDRCGKSMPWREVVVSAKRPTCFWCGSCAEIMLGEPEAPGSEPTVCGECGRPVFYGESVFIDGLGRICTDCLQGFGHLDSTQTELRANTILECANCNGEFDGREEAIKIHYRRDLQAYLCNECLEDPSMPFCVPSA